MKTIISEKLPRIIKSRKILEKQLKVKITNRGKEVTITGKPEDEYIATKVIDAINFGFSIPRALLINKEDYIFEIINIKEHTKRKDLKRIRARIIGKKGQTLRTLEELSKCFFELKNNEIGILGHPEYMENAQESIIHLIKGAKHGNVYAYLEKHQIEPVLDLGLKEKKKRK